jgi:Zn finger protein HypA/HybF involved in hydrogenase expression
MITAQDLHIKSKIKLVEVRCKFCKKRHFDAAEKADKSKIDTVVVWICPKCSYKNVIVL